MRYLTISRKRCYQSLVRAGDGKELPDKSCSSGLEMQTQWERMQTGSEGAGKETPQTLFPPLDLLPVPHIGWGQRLGDTGKCICEVTTGDGNESGSKGRIANIIPHCSFTFSVLKRSCPGWHGSVDWLLACKLRVPFQVKAHAWVVGQVPGWGRSRCNWSVYFSHSDVYIPLFLPPFPSL